MADGRTKIGRLEKRVETLEKDLANLHDMWTENFKLIAPTVQYLLNKDKQKDGLIVTPRH